MTDHTVKGIELRDFDGKGLRVLVIHARWNMKVIHSLIKIIDPLLEGTLSSLRARNVENIDVFAVPGSFELPVFIFIYSVCMSIFDFKATP